MIDWKHVTDLRDKVGADGLAQILDLILQEIELRLRIIDPQPQAMARDLERLRTLAEAVGFLALGALCRKGEDQLNRDGRFDLGPASLKASFGHARQRMLRELPQIAGCGPWGQADAVA